MAGYVPEPTHVTKVAIRLVKFVNEENAVDLHSVGRFQKHSLRRSRGNISYECCQKHECLSLYDLLTTGRHFLGVSFRL